VSTISVIVSTVPGREKHLDSCLAGLMSQSCAPHEIAVVRGRPSPVEALLAGWELTTGEWVAFIDDVAVPHTDWLERVASHLGDSTL
jgi:hypothetical protein